MDDRVESAAGATTTQTPAPPITGLSDQDLRRATDFLLDNCRIGNMRSHYDKYRRYVPLQIVQMFQSLVSLYESLFKSLWQNFKRMMDAFTVPTGTAVQIYAARVYISHWFHDLYCSNREATRNISPLAFNEVYFYERMPYSTEYDNFLTLLNACIKPTHLQLIEEDVLLIPTFGPQPNWQAENEAQLNPFHVDHFSLNHDVFYGLLQIMKERKEWKTSKLMTNTVGRPCWLFDWHDSHQICAWFPRERNYNDTDVALAYIIGVACTPKLGKRDVDDWQYPAYNVVPPMSAVHNAPRVDQRRFSGSFEVRTLEVEHNYTLPESICQLLDSAFPDFYKKRKKSKGPSGGAGPIVTTTGDSTATPSASADTEVQIPPIVRFRIIDWVYHSRVILNYDWNTRTGAFRIICIAN